jgi:site-specific recombinase XerC
VLRQHLADFVDEEPTAFVFTGPNGATIWRGNFNKLAKWPEKVQAVGVPGLHFHDLRHSGNTFAARTGVSMRELMARMGHNSAQAAMIYQHATAEADREIAKAVDSAVKAARKKAKKTTSGRKPKTGKPAPGGTRKRGESSDDPDDGTAGAVARRR